MHELSLAGSILALVEQAAAREGFTRVNRLVLDCGALAGVETGALRFALDAVAPGTLLDGADIVIDETPGEAACTDCGRTVNIGSRLDPCPACGGTALRPTGGLTLSVRDLIVHDTQEA